jgi:hypothetical protein
MQIMPTELSSAICWTSSILVAIALTFADRIAGILELGVRNNLPRHVL